MRASGLRMAVYALALANLVVLLWHLPREPAARTAPPPLQAPPLRLVDEPAPPAAAGPVSPGTAEAGAASGCWRLTAASAETARALAEAARAAGLAVELAQERARETVGYWVYLPPFPDRAAARAAVADLAAKGVRDVQLLGGARANAVSLGLFRVRALAERRRAQIAALGFQPVIEVHEREVQRWRVVLRGRRADAAHLARRHGVRLRACSAAPVG